MNTGLSSASESSPREMGCVWGVCTEYPPPPCALVEVGGMDGVVSWWFDTVTGPCVSFVRVSYGALECVVECPPLDCLPWSFEEGLAAGGPPIDWLFVDGGACDRPSL